MTKITDGRMIHETGSDKAGARDKAFPGTETAG